MSNLNFLKKYNIRFGNPRSKKINNSYKKKNNSYNKFHNRSRRESSIISCDIDRLEYYYDKKNDKGRYKEYKCNVFLHKSKKTLVNFSISTGKKVEYLQFSLPPIDEINTSILVTDVTSFFYYDGYANEYLITKIECPIINGKYIQGLRFYLR